MKICYISRDFREDTLAIIEQADSILSGLADQGFSVTLRTLYYQFVSRNLIENKESEYKRLGSLINDARLAGLIDWDHITDRTRNLQSITHWNSPEEIIRAVAPSYAVDSWAGQQLRPEVWIEKDALIGVIEPTCLQFDVPFFSCRGYVSQSEMWGAAQRLVGYLDAGQTPVIFHLGDHDPSGMDMTRDIAERLELFTGTSINISRLALNWDQIQQFSPPPNPAKVSDSRSSVYIQKFGQSSWELDALEPVVIASLIGDAINEIIDPDLRKEAINSQADGKNLLHQVAQRWEDITELLSREAL